MKKLLLTSLLLIIGTISNAQNIAKEIQDISNQVKQVKSIAHTVDQTLSQESGSIVIVDAQTTDTKGKTTSENYRFNIADINPSGMKSTLDGKDMVVELTVKNKDKFIERKKADAVEYVNKVQIEVSDIDNARLLIDAVKAAITTAEQMEASKYRYNNLDQILTELFKAVQPTEEFPMQRLESTADKKDKLKLSIQDQKGKQEAFEFNLQDLNPFVIAFQISGKKVELDIETQTKQKIVKVYENDQAKAYAAKFTIYPTTVDNAKAVRKLLQLAIQAAQGKLPVMAPSPKASSTSSATETKEATPSKSKTTTKTTTTKKK